MFIVPPDSYRDGGSCSIIRKLQMGVDEKLNSITERKSEQFAWRSSKLETTGHDSSKKADHIIN